MQYNVPVTEIQESLYAILSKCIVGYNVYDDNTPITEIQNQFKDMDNIRFVMLREVEASPSRTKRDTLIWDVEATIYCLSNYPGKKYVNEMLNDVCTVVTSVPLSLENYNFLTAEIKRVQISSENCNGPVRWHTGSIEVNIKVQNKKL